MDYQDGSVDCNQCGAGVFKQSWGTEIDTLSERLVEAWNKRVK